MFASITCLTGVGLWQCFVDRRAVRPQLPVDFDFGEGIDWLAARVFVDLGLLSRRVAIIDDWLAVFTAALRTQLAVFARCQAEHLGARAEPHRRLSRLLV